MTKQLITDPDLGCVYHTSKALHPSGKRPQLGALPGHTIPKTEDLEDYDHIEAPCDDGPVSKATRG
jgi:hypothetical protein